MERDSLVSILPPTAESLQYVLHGHSGAHAQNSMSAIGNSSSGSSFSSAAEGFVSQPSSTIINSSDSSAQASSSLSATASANTNAASSSSTSRLQIPSAKTVVCNTQAIHETSLKHINEHTGKATVLTSNEFALWCGSVAGATLNGVTLPLDKEVYSVIPSAEIVAM